jgi:hypothetical protein
MHDDGMADQVLLLIGLEVAMFTFEFLGSIGVVDTLVGAQIVFVGEFSSACWTWIGALFDGEVYGQVNVKKGLANGGVGAEMVSVCSGVWLRHLLVVVGDVVGPLLVFWLQGTVEKVEMSSEVVVPVEVLGTVRAQIYRLEVGCFVVGTGMGGEIEAGCELCAAMGAKIDDGEIDRHRLGAEAASGLIVELVDFVKMTSEGGAIGKLFDAQRALMDV